MLGSPVIPEKAWSRDFKNSKYDTTILPFCSALKKLAEKACWDVAESKANGDRQLVEYLVSKF